VGAVTIDRVPAKFSSGNLSVRIAAPGKAVPAQGNDGQYYVVDGTSPACAVVAGVAALLKAKYPKITPAQVTEALTMTAQQSTTATYSVLTGFGIVDADAALVKAGQLMKTKARTQVSTTAHFGDGPTAVPVAPVTARGGGWFEAFIVLMIVAGLVVLAGGVGLYLTQGARRT
jgi:subtilisin family serine protease